MYNEIGVRINARMRIKFFFFFLILKNLDRETYNQIGMALVIKRAVLKSSYQGFSVRQMAMEVEKVQCLVRQSAKSLLNISKLIA
jgi:hypothetical protein